MKKFWRGFPFSSSRFQFHHLILSLWCTNFSISLQSLQATGLKVAFRQEAYSFQMETNKEQTVFEHSVNKGGFYFKPEGFFCALTCKKYIYISNNFLIAFKIWILLGMEVFTKYGWIIFFMQCQRGENQAASDCCGEQDVHVEFHRLMSPWLTVNCNNR